MITSVPEWVPPRTAVRLTIAMALAVGVATFAFRFLSLVGFPNDHFVTLTSGAQMLLGEWPTRDFEDPGYPLTDVVSALGQALGGRSLLSEAIIVCTAFAVGAYLTVTAVASWTGRLWLGLWAALVEVVLLPRSYSYPKILLSAAACAVFVGYARRPVRRWLAAMVGVTAIGFLFRHDLGVYLAISSGVLLVAVHRRDGWPVVARRSAFWLLATIVTLTPYLLYVQWYRGVPEYVAAGVRFSRLEFGQTALRWSGMSFSTAPAALAGWLFYAFWVVPVMAAAVYLRAMRAGTRTIDAAPAVIAMALCTNVGFLRDPLLGRVPDAIVPIVVLLAWMTWYADEHIGGVRRVIAAAMTTAALAALFIAAILLGATWEQLNRGGINRGVASVARRFHDVVAELREQYAERQIPSDFAFALVPFFRYVQACTGPQARLFVPGFIPEVPYYSRRGFAGGHVTSMGPFYGSDAEQRETIARMSRQDVPFVVAAPGGLVDLGRRLPLIDEHVRTRYRQLITVTVDGADEPGYVLVRNDAKPVRTYGRDEWPCFR